MKLIIPVALMSRLELERADQKGIHRRERIQEARLVALPSGSRLGPVAPHLAGPTPAGEDPVRHGVLLRVVNALPA